MGLLARNAAADVKPPTAKPKEQIIWTPDQAVMFLEAATQLAGNDYTSHTWAALFDVLLATGMRRGEALAINWADVDLNVGAVSISRAVGTLGNAVHVQQPKTTGSRRTVPLPAGTIEHSEGTRFVRMSTGSNSGLCGTMLASCSAMDLAITSIRPMSTGLFSG